MKKLFIFLCTFIILNSAFISTAYAAEYGYEYPDYVPVSGGAYIEAESSLGTVTLVFPIDYKDGTFGFIDSGVASVCNLTRNTVYGYVYTRNNQSYEVRAAYGELIEYQLDDRYPYNEWTDLRLTQILNTNIQLIDLTEQGRQTDFQKYEFTYQEKFFISLIAVCTFSVNLVMVLKGSKNGNY